MRDLLTVCALAIAVMVIAIWSLSAGAVDVPWSVIANTLFGLDGPRQDFIIFNSRLPRTLLALLTGGALALSGVLVQALLRNPLASPKIIGINSGAALAVCLTVLLVPGAGLRWLPAAAVAGGIFAAAIITAGADMGRFSTGRLALVGIAVGFLCDAGVDFILATSSDAQFSAPLIWLTGSLWARGWLHVQMVWPWLIMLSCLALTLSFYTDVMQLGDTGAATLGVAVRPVRLAIMGLAVVLAAISVSAVGVLGFVGLMAPHMARSLVGGSHARIMPCAVFIGMGLVTLADAAGRAMSPPVEVSAGIVTALFGAPFFIFIMIRNGKGSAV
jgi:iron complex transport system permease protein